MAAVVLNKATTQLTRASSEEDAKNTYDAWAATYEHVSGLIPYNIKHIKDHL